MGSAQETARDRRMAKVQRRTKLQTGMIYMSKEHSLVSVAISVIVCAAELL